MTRFIAILAAMLIAGSAGAVTQRASETDASGGDFSNSHRTPSVIASDILTVTGAQNRNSDIDWIVFDGFADGTERLDFTFTNEGGEWGGLHLRLKADPFKNRHDWWPLLDAWSIDGVTGARSKTVSYVLGGTTGPIHVALDFYNGNDFRNGNGLAYTIAKIVGAPEVAPMSAPAPGPSPVPVPAALPLALAGLGALGAVGWRRKRG